MRITTARGQIVVGGGLSHLHIHPRFFRVLQTPAQSIRFGNRFPQLSFQALQGLILLRKLPLQEVRAWWEEGRDTQSSASLELS